MPFKSAKQEAYLRVNKPDVYEKFKAHTPDAPTSSSDRTSAKRPANRFAKYPSNRELASWNGKL